MSENYRTTVIDAGGRYGLHPSWKPFSGELDYYLFEPDSIESKRLLEKYAGRSDEVKIIDKAIAKENGKLTINFFKNRAMSSSIVRHPVSALFKGERLAEVEIVESVEVAAVSIDSFAADRELAVDFLKLDTEGTEYAILEGAAKQLRDNILGVRCEVAFDRIFEGMPLFGDLNKLLLDQGYYLLNLDYDGRGDNQNDFVQIPGRYGILTASDAVWLKKQDLLFADAEKSNRSLEAQVLKYAAFCLNNSAPDVALDTLFKARRAHGADFDRLRETRLYRFVDLKLQKHFYSLKWQPGQTLLGCQKAFQEIFGKKMKELNEFMESRELNPD
ncbi:MAG: FkbM family methyltransferase [Deltaproteobacteria bacterium]|nr:FkbM family methyltransferase [Deltaproteobacteria bacterium]